MQYGTGLRARRFPRFADLPLDLRLTENHGVESGGYAVEVAHGGPIARDIAVLARSAGGDDRQPLPKQRPHRVECRFVVRNQIELRAVAGGKQHTTAGAGCHDPRQRARHFVCAMREALADVEWCRAVIHPHDLDPHLRMTRHRNRSAPGWVSFSATYTSSTAPKPAMLARAARRPAQWRTTRTQTAQPSTTHVKMPHTTCALATCRPPENCAPYPSASKTPSVNAGKPATNANRLSRSSRSSGGKRWKNRPKRPALSSRKCRR